MSGCLFKIFFQTVFALQLIIINKQTRCVVSEPKRIHDMRIKFKEYFFSISLSCGLVLVFTASGDGRGGVRGGQR